MTDATSRSPRRSRALAPEQRQQLKSQWTAFVTELRSSLGWTQDQLAKAVGAAGPAVVCRWESDGPRGSIPSGSARKALTELARRQGLIAE